MKSAKFVQVIFILAKSFVSTAGQAEIARFGTGKGKERFAAGSSPTDRMLEGKVPTARLCKMDRAA